MYILHMYYMFRTTYITQVYILHMYYMFRTTCLTQVYILHMYYMCRTTCVIQVYILHMYYMCRTNYMFHTGVYPTHVLHVFSANRWMCDGESDDVPVQTWHNSKENATLSKPSQVSWLCYDNSDRKSLHVWFCLIVYGTINISGFRILFFFCSKLAQIDVTYYWFAAIMWLMKDKVHSTQSDIPLQVFDVLSLYMFPAQDLICFRNNPQLISP